VVIPGRPGESATVLSSDEIVGPDGSTYNQIDVWFVRMMIPHHTQALLMAALAPACTANPQILAIAERVRAAQAPEVASLKAWLRARSLGEDDPSSGHDHASMRGMQTPKAMQELAETRGEAFDRRFVAMMSDHHQGAVDMARDVLELGRNLQVEELATGIAVEQTAEIDRLRAILSK
jgi:uncharacterized protein (DUF305 family)